jgi:hypothetical protein
MLMPEQVQHASRATARVAPTLTDLFSASSWFGLIGFGGGVSVLATIRRIAVERGRWVTDREFANTATVARVRTPPREHVVIRWSAHLHGSDAACSDAVERAGSLYPR